MELITGTAGKPHVTSMQHRSIFEKIIGKGSYILNDNELLEPELQSNQSLRIRSGMLCHHGSISEVRKNTYDEVVIANGSQSMKRIDLVVARYKKDPETEVETMTWVVIQGTPAVDSPTAPAHMEGNMQDGDLTDDCPVFKVYLEGIQVTKVEKLLNVLVENLSSLNSKTIKYEIVPIVSGLSVGANTMLRQGVISETDLNKYLSKNKATKYIGFCTLDGGYGDQMQVTFTMYEKNLYCQVDNRFTSTLTIYPSVCMLMV